MKQDYLFAHGVISKNETTGHVSKGDHKVVREFIAHLSNQFKEVNTRAGRTKRVAPKTQAVSWFGYLAMIRLGDPDATEEAGLISAFFVSSEDGIAIATIVLR